MERTDRRGGSVVCFRAFYAVERAGQVTRQDTPATDAGGTVQNNSFLPVASMQFPAPLIEGRLIRRYQRFLADVSLVDGTVVTAHCPNTGSMLGCNGPGSRVWLSESETPGRKYRHTWEIVETIGGTLVGINTARTNRLVREAITDCSIGELAGYTSLRSEVVYGEEKSRIDLLLEDGQGRKCYVEVKNVTALSGDAAIFPDAVSARGTRHLRELMRMRAAGHRAVIFFCVPRADAWRLRPADEIDPLYGRTLREAIAAGVEALAYVWRVSREGAVLERRIPVVV